MEKASPYFCARSTKFRQKGERVSYKKETVRICVRRSGEKRNAVRGEKQKFPENLPGTAVLGPLHDGGEKFLVPVFGEDKKGLVNDLLCAGVRAALCQPEYCCQ